MLERAGVTNRVLCRTAEAAIGWLDSIGTESIPVAAFVDVRLPVLSGFDLLKKIRESERLRSMVVVLLSASDEPRNLGKALQLGADGYLVKFPSLSATRDILAAIQAVARDNTARPPLAVTSNLLVGAVPSALAVSKSA